ncbi:MAG TPA: Rrf2 family transcriptional regulator [Ktedonobacterales bacterium]|jgi:Rrf2 family protein
MMRVSTRGEYGVRVMVDLARHYGKGPRSLTDISSEEQLPLPYLEQLVKLLRDKELIVSTRGAHGGYQLSRDPLNIRMSEVIRVLEGPIAPMICAVDGEMELICDRLDCCSTQYLWAKLRDALVQTLDRMTLAELASASAQERLPARGQTVPAPGAVSAQRLIPVTPLIVRGGYQDTSDLE